MKIQAKSAKLTRGTDILDFNLQIKKPIVVIDYYSNDEFLYQLQCPVNQANRIYKQSIYEGYIEHVSAPHLIIK